MATECVNHSSTRAGRSHALFTLKTVNICALDILKAFDRVDHYTCYSCQWIGQYLRTLLKYYVTSLLSVLSAYNRTVPSPSGFVFVLV